MQCTSLHARTRVALRQYCTFLHRKGRSAGRLEEDASDLVSAVSIGRSKAPEAVAKGNAHRDTNRAHRAPTEERRKIASSPSGRQGAYRQPDARTEVSDSTPNLHRVSARDRAYLSDASRAAAASHLRRRIVDRYLWLAHVGKTKTRSRAVRTESRQLAVLVRLEGQKLLWAGVLPDYILDLVVGILARCAKLFLAEGLLSDLSSPFTGGHPSAHISEELRGKICAGEHPVAERVPSLKSLNHVLHAKARHGDEEGATAVLHAIKHRYLYPVTDSTNRGMLTLCRRLKDPQGASLWFGLIRRHEMSDFSSLATSYTSFEKASACFEDVFLPWYKNLALRQRFEFEGRFDALLAAVAATGYRDERPKEVEAAVRAMTKKLAYFRAAAGPPADGAPPVRAPGPSTLGVFAKLRELAGDFDGVVAILREFNELGLPLTEPLASTFLSACGSRIDALASAPSPAVRWPPVPAPPAEDPPPPDSPPRSTPPPPPANRGPPSSSECGPAAGRRRCPEDDMAPILQFWGCAADENPPPPSQGAVGCEQSRRAGHSGQVLAEVKDPARVEEFDDASPGWTLEGGNKSKLSMTVQNVARDRRVGVLQAAEGSGQRVVVSSEVGKHHEHNEHNEHVSRKPRVVQHSLEDLEEQRLEEYEKILSMATSVFHTLLLSSDSVGPSVWVALASVYGRLGQHSRAHSHLLTADSMGVQISSDFVDCVAAAYSTAGLGVPHDITNFLQTVYQRSGATGNPTLPSHRHT
ncbi:hypothetical protein DIPPA_18797 [Diplonema papillatum]|nr:hypothetical protein DIPPA_18797 [Diplonema papillatum]